MFAFLFSKIGVWIVGAAVVAALVGGGYWYVTHLQAKVAGLGDKVAGLESRAEVIEKAQKATDEFIKKKTIIQTRVVKEKADVDQVVESGDNSAMQRLFLDRGMLQRPQTNPAASGASGNSGNLPR